MENLGFKGISNLEAGYIYCPFNIFTGEILPEYIESQKYHYIEPTLIQKQIMIMICGRYPFIGERVKKE